MYRRGEHREAMLRDYREGLRLRVNPETGTFFTEDEITRATAKGGRFWKDYDALDLLLMGVQKRDEFLANQIRIDRSGSAFLRNYHFPLWGEEYLPAFGGSGTVLATGNPGVIWQGSSEVPNPGAVYGTDPAGLRYQVLAPGEANAQGEAELLLIGIDGGDETNIEPGTVITWANAPIGSTGTATVVGDKFSGGSDAETDADAARRLADRIRHKPASGNWAHIRAFARKASVSVEDAFVYCCAFHAGSTLVAIVQKRGNVPGPTARIPSIGVLTRVRAALVPPASTSLPGVQHLVVVPPVAQSSNAIVRLLQPVDSGVGWRDLQPFPPIIAGTTAVAVSLVTNQQDIRITCQSAGLLPDGASSSTDVHLMVWDAPTSAFLAIPVQTVTDLGGSVYRVQLAEPLAGHTFAVGDWVSPDMLRRSTLADAVVRYYDGLGTGEVIDLVTDDRAGRAYRNPQPSELAPSRGGQGIVSVITEALGASVTDAALVSLAPSVAAVPADPITGPSLLVPGKFAVYPQT